MSSCRVRKASRSSTATPIPATRSPARRAATLDTYKEEGLLTRAAEFAPYWEQAIHSLKDAPHVIDIRNCGLMGAIELEPRPGQPGKRAYEVFVKAFEAGVLIRVTGDIIALSPPLIVERAHIDRIVECVGSMLRTTS